MLKEKTYNVTLVTKEPFRIGATSDPLSGADNPITKLAGKMVIPGSTIKGALRSEIERHLIDTYDKNGQFFKPCIPGAALSKDEEKLVDSGKYRDKDGACHYPCNPDPKKCGNKSHPICPACYFLGSQGLVGFVKVPFLYAEGSPTDITGTRIDRARKTVFEKRGKGALYTYEVVPDGISFSGILSVLVEDSVLGWKIGQARPLKDVSPGDEWLKSSPIDSDKIIKEFILERLTAIKVLGGYKSKGFGNVEIKIG
ncbi:MAG: RAMP superfamily CRISPR-associated protein [Candidatus Zixiibacteriota bacterium]